MAFEILIRGIDEDGNAKEQEKITMKDGSLPERVMILAEGKEEDGEGKTVFCKAGCSVPEICMMIKHNKDMDKIVRVYMGGQMMMRMLGMMADEEAREHEEADIADGIGQAFSPD